MFSRLMNLKVSPQLCSICPDNIVDRHSELNAQCQPTVADELRYMFTTQ